MRIRNSASKAPRIEMLPLIDIVFLLLVFFIYAMLSMAVHRGLQLDLPESTQAEASEEIPFSLSIRTDDNGIILFLNDNAIPLAQLAEQLVPQHNATAQKPSVLIFADETVSYQQLYKVLDELKKTGISNISLQASSE